MAERSGIEWTDHTFNPWIGCTKVSPACDHCYAERTAKRMQVQWGAGKARKRTSASYWREPLKWNARAERTGQRERVFCASLADVFDNEVPWGWRDHLWGLIAETPHLDWLLLTKRIGNAERMLPPDWGDGYPNVWLGATVVTKEEADRDTPKLLNVPARVRFLSMEPLLGPVDLIQHLAWSRCSDCGIAHDIGHEWAQAYLSDGFVLCSECDDGLHAVEGRHIDWVIAGGESGPHARPMHPEWVRSLRDQCDAAQVPFFFKQWGEWLPGSQIPKEERDAVAETLTFESTYVFDGDNDPLNMMARVGKKSAGRLLDGRTWDEVPV